MDETAAESTLNRGELINEIRQQIRGGYGIVPLVGSGMSAASGIPAGQDYQAYLFHCLAKAFGTDVSGLEVVDAWDPSELRWPAYSDVPQMEDLNQKMIEWSLSLQQRIHRPPIGTRDAQARHHADAQWQASGAVADWRATLHLLSRISLGETNVPQPPAGTPRRLVRLRAADPRVIDSFFVNLTEGKQPNTAHRLLVHLADALRVKVILTTNFDNLIETAFQRLDMPTVTFDVHYEARLPDARLVRARRSVVKLHGGRYGLRADFTLDTYPHREDIETFLSYLAVYDLLGRKNVPQRQLLVMGVSGRERRTVGLIGHALRELGDKFRVYWVCHRQDDIPRIVDEFKAVLAELYTGDSDPRRSPETLLKRLHVTSTPNLGLFLLELYQNIFLSLPPAGAAFDMVWPVPPPCAARVQRGPAVAEQAARIEAAIATWKQLPIVVSGPLGTPIVGTHAFYSQTGRFRCVWLELDSGFDPADFALLALNAIAHEVGISTAPPFPFRRPLQSGAEMPAPLRDRLNELSRQTNRRIVLFVNARHFPGSAGDGAASAWNETHWRELWQVVKWLSDKVAVVLFAWDDLLEAWKAPQPEQAEYLRLEQALDPEPPERIAKLVTTQVDAMSGPEQDSWTQFLLGITLFRHPCYLSALQSWALQKAPRRLSVNRDNDEARFERTHEFLESMRDWDAIRDDDGQSVFMYPALQRALRERLVGKGINPTMLPEAHQGIADWYVKLYRASGDAQAALESIRHRLECVRHAWPARARSIDLVSLVRSAINETGITLALLAPAMSSSPRPATLAHLFAEIIDLASLLVEVLARAPGPDEATVVPAFNFTKTLQDHADRLKAMFDEYFDHPGRKRQPIAQRVDAMTDDPAIDEVTNLSNSRKYAAAEEKALALLLGLGIEATMLFDPQPRTHAREWINGQADSRQVGVVLAALRRLQQLKLYQAEVARLNEESMARQQAFLRQGEEVYIFATELMRYLGDVNFLQEENAFIRSNTGILLSWMNRHQEAHRRYSEAYGYLSYVSGPYVPLRFATVDLRRTETFLCQLARAKNMTFEQHFGLVYDAIAGVERASYKVADTSVRTRWYAWLRELELSTCCEVARLAWREPGAHLRFGTCRNQSTIAEWFHRVLGAANYLVADGADPFRLARYVDLGQTFSDLAERIQSRDDAAASRNRSPAYATCKLSELEAIAQVCESGVKELRAQLTAKPDWDPAVTRYVEKVVAAGARPALFGGALSRA